MCQYLDIWGTKAGVFPLCAGLGLFFYVMLILSTLKKTGADEQKENSVLCPLPFALLFGVFVAYSSDVINHWSLDRFLNNPFAFGITYYGFLWGIIFFAIVYTKIFHCDTFYFLNMWVPPLVLAQACGRIGCFFAGCCYGIPCNSFPLSVVYPENTLPFQSYGAVALLPIQLIEASYLLIVSMFIFHTDFCKRFAWYLILVGAGRFLTEFGRGDNRGFLAGCTTLSPAQIISIVVFTSGFFCLFHKKKQLEEGVKNE